MVWAVLAGGWYRKSLLFLPIALLVIVPLSGIGSRLGTLTAVLSGSTTTADPSVVTRKRLQLDAWNMFLDRPITGHGIGSYPAMFPQYDRLANFDDRVDIVVAAHNFYFEQAADGGVVLLVCWALLLRHDLLRRPADDGRRPGCRRRAPSRFLALGVIGGLTGWLLASVFLHLSDFRALLLMAALAAVADVRRRAADGPPTPGRSGNSWGTGIRVRAARPGRGAVAGWAGAAALGLVGVTAAVTDRADGLHQLDDARGDADRRGGWRHRVRAGRGQPRTDRADAGRGAGPVASASVRWQEQAGRFPASAEIGRTPGVDVAPSRLGGAVVVTVTADRADAGHRSDQGRGGAEQGPGRRPADGLPADRGAR